MEEKRRKRAITARFTVGDKNVFLFSFKLKGVVCDLMNLKFLSYESLWFNELEVYKF